MKEILKSKKFFCTAFCLLFIVSAIGYIANTKVGYKEIKPYNVPNYNSSNAENQEVDALADNSVEGSPVLYLSDIPYRKAEIAYKNIALDKTTDNAALTLKTNGSTVTFKKGIYAHATSTVEYDITNYKEYVNFGVYYGLNTTSTKGNGVKFYIYTSIDGENWTLRTEEEPTALTGSDNAVQVYN